MVPHVEPGGLVTGGLHEFLAPGGSRGWAPPMAVLGHLATAALAAAPPRRGTVAWIGQRVCPEPAALPSHALSHASMIVRPRGTTARFWAIERTMRCPAVCCVVADGSDATRTMTRRLHLVAEEHDCTLLLARPPREHDTITSAATRWRIHRVPSQTTRPRWRLELLRCRGRQRLIGRDPPSRDSVTPQHSSPDVSCSWLLEWDPIHGPVDVSTTGAVHCARLEPARAPRLAPHVADRSRRSTAAPIRHAR
ncbi:MAG: hypothetical protein MK116_06930 [Phycisphaerales bacterium]|nr:hypothetical protein [Phycisphaerales bacterium]